MVYFLKFKKVQQKQYLLLLEIIYYTLLLRIFEALYGLRTSHSWLSVYHTRKIILTLLHNNQKFGDAITHTMQHFQRLAIPTNQDPPNLISCSSPRSLKQRSDFFQSSLGRKEKKKKKWRNR
jgi:hypothetical protein